MRPKKRRKKKVLTSFWLQNPKNTPDKSEKYSLKNGFRRQNHVFQLWKWLLYHLHRTKKPAVDIVGRLQSQCGKFIQPAKSYCGVIPVTIGSLRSILDHSSAHKNTNKTQNTKTQKGAAKK